MIPDLRELHWQQTASIEWTDAGIEPVQRRGIYPPLGRERVKRGSQRELPSELNLKAG